MKRVACIGQAPPRSEPVRPFGRTMLYSWFASIGIADKHIKDYFTFGAQIDYFPGSKKGSHLLPTPTEIKAGRPQLAKKLRDFQPEIVVPIGKLSISECLAIPLKEVKLPEVIGQKFQADPYNVLGHAVTVIPLPHPSGASSWYYRADNKQLLLQALQLLRTSFF